MLQQLTTLGQVLKNRFFGTAMPPKDMEGIAKVTVYDKDGNSQEVVGCFVRNNEKLIQLINPRCSFVKKYEKTKYFAYIQTPLSVEKAVILVSRQDALSQPYEVDNLKAEEKTAKKGINHLFIPCDSQDFNSSSFLRRYSKDVCPQGSAVGDNKVYSLGKDNSWMHFTCLEQNKGEQDTHNDLIIDDDIFDNLQDGPIFLEDKTTVVGFCSKHSTSALITIEFFHRDPVAAWKASAKPATESTEESTPTFDNGTLDSIRNNDSMTTNECEAASSVSSEGLDNGGSCDEGKDDPLNQIDCQPGSTLSATGVNEYISRRNTPVETSFVHSPAEEEGSPVTGNIPRGLEQVKLSQLCQKDHSVIPRASKTFDDKSRRKHHLSSVLSLADRLQAPPLIVSKCSSNYDHNPSLEIFKNPSVSMLSLDSLCCTLANIHRSDVADLITLQFEEKDLKSKTVSILLSENKYQDLLDQVTAKLNESTNHHNWRYLGTKLKIEDHVLDGIEHGTNPTETFLVDHAYCAVDPTELRLDRFYEHMKELGREDEISILFWKYGITKDDKQHMKKVFTANTPPMEDLSKLLNRENCKNWQHLAVRLRVSSEDYFPFIPDKAVSPTGILLNWLIAAKPDFTVSELVEHLRALKRFDVSEVFETAAIALNNSK